MNRVLQVACIGATLSLFVVLGCGPKAEPPRAVKAPPVQPAANASVTPAGTPAAPTLAQFNVSLGGAQQQIDATLASLAAVTDPAQADVRGAYDKYCNSLVRMKDHAASLRKEADAMRASRDAYFSNWEAKAESDNPTIRASAEASRKRLRDSQEQILIASNDAKDAYAPFIKNLEDIKKHLAPDPSKAAAAQLVDASKTVQADGAVVKEKLGALSRTLESVQGGV